MSKLIRTCSLFSGCGGLDLGFSKEGFEIVFANENDHLIWDTFRKNHPSVNLCTKSIRDVCGKDIPGNIDVLIGGPPCQAYSESGVMKGEQDPRGKLLFEYARLLSEIKPKVFLAENVRGILTKKHEGTLGKLYSLFDKHGYDTHFFKFNLADYGIPQDRVRVFFIGTRKDLNIKELDLGLEKVERVTLRSVIYDLKDSSVPQNEKSDVLNHEYFVQGYSGRYLTRNRVRGWDDVSFTIQASARHIPQHPSVIMKEKEKYDYEFENGYSRRLSLRECARIQTFPDDFEFFYTDLRQGYKMVGNAVPPAFASLLARSIRDNILII